MHALPLVLELRVPLHADLGNGSIEAVGDSGLQASLGLAQPRLRGGQAPLHVRVEILAGLLQHVREAALELRDGGLEELGLVGTGRLARLGLRLRLARRLRTSSEQARADAATRRFRARSVHRGEWSYTRASCGGGGNRRSESCASQSRIRS